MISEKFLSLSFVLVLIASNYLISCNNEGFFTVAGVSLLKSQQVYRVSVAHQGYKDDKSLQIGIKEVKENSTGLEFYKNVTLSGDGVQNIDFDLNNLLESDYILNVKSMTGENFDSSLALHMNTKKYSTFIQTDKSIYKPGDNVKFRVFVLDADTKPFKFDDIEIFVTDGGRNRVKQFVNPKVKFVNGVYKNELQLSDSPVIGSWLIHVKVNNESVKNKDFEVKEYVLPKFELLIDAEEGANFKDGKIRATVKAKYTFGKFAKGTAKVTAQADRKVYFRGIGYDEPQTVTKIVDIDGKKFVEFDIANELKMNQTKFKRIAYLTASFVDELSQKEMNVSQKVEIYPTPYLIELSGSAGKIKPGIPYKIRASVKHLYKNMPVTDKHHPLKFNITNYYDVMKKCERKIYPINYYEFDSDESNSTQKTLKEEDIRKEEYDCRDVKEYNEIKEVFLEDGHAVLIIELTSNVTRIKVEASYLEETTTTHTFNRAFSASDQFIQLQLLTKNPSPKEKISIRVESNIQLNHVYYIVANMKGLAESKHVKFNASKNYILEITPNYSITTSIVVIVYYFTEDGEIIADKEIIQFDGQLPNYINLRLSSEQVEPGKNITITVDSTANSYIALLGVDQSVLLLKSGNDIDQKIVDRNLNTFETADRINYEEFDNQFDKFYSTFSGETKLITNAKEQFNQKYIPIYRNESHYPKKPSWRNKKIKIHKSNKVGYMRFGGSIQQSTLTESDIALKTPKLIEIRKEFPETWLFEDLQMNDTNQLHLTKKAPDTITSWIITGFSLNSEVGLGLTKEPTKLNVFQPFFVSTNLPYSIKRGEVVSIPFAVFNYLGTDQNVVVKFFNSDREFEFVEVNENENSVSRQKRALEKERTKEILVKSNEGTSISFMIRSLKAGHITIKVTAESQLAGDGVERQLKVEPEGVPQYFNEAVFVDLKNQKDFKRSIKITIPSDAVEDSTRIETSVIGDILGPTLENLDNLIQLPYGCAEQNMLKFVPNILVLEYLTNLNKLNPETEEKLKKYLDVGYQKQLTYKNKGGSYSGFGMRSENGSTWLTAYVAKSFNQASKYIDIDQEVISEALNFLSSVQSDNGSFPEFGHVSYTPMQGGASKGIGLTAYTLITFLENKQHSEKYKDTIKKALDYVVKNVWELDDTYVLAIASYALQLAGHAKKDELLTKLNNKAEETEGMKYWKKDVVEEEGRSPWFYRRRSTVNVEMSSYAMLAFILAGQDQRTIPVMKWLVSQRNYRGGFQSTQDTVVGLQALSQLATKIPFSSSEIRIVVKPKYSAQKSFDLNSGNSLILQKAELPSSSRTFEVTATGNGFAILQISYKYNLDKSDKYPRFNLKPTIDSTSNKEFLNLKVCTSFVPDSQDDKSNMAIMEVTLPSGFTFDNDHFKELMATEKKVETKDGDTVIMVYFDDIEAKDICPSFHAYRTHAVANQKPAPIVVYDYYDNSRHARAFYNSPEISLCDICQGSDDCKDVCEVPIVEVQ